LVLGQNFHQLAIFRQAHCPEQTGAISMAVPERKPGQVSQALLLGTTVVLAVASGFAGIAREVATLGLGVGDILTFDPTHKYPLESGARMEVKRQDGAGCTLDVAVMQLAGGSLVIEQRAAGSFRVHWAGARTGDGTSDCGSEADFALTPSDVNILAAASNGSGPTIVFRSQPN
jgi:hypothetical protein